MEAFNMKKKWIICISIIAITYFVLSLFDFMYIPADKYPNIIRKMFFHDNEKATVRREKLTANRISILRLMAENPYITKIELAAAVGISATSIMRNIEYMRNKYLRRVGPDNGGFWEIIE